MPLKSVGNASVMVGDVGKAEDSGAIQTNIVRIDGQRSVYIPVLKQGGDSNTITIVNGMKDAIKNLVDIPASLKTAVVFDQSHVCEGRDQEPVEGSRHRSSANRHHDPCFFGESTRNLRRAAVDPPFCSVCLLVMKTMGGSINTMLLGGLALAFSRLIDDSVVVLENIFRYMEMGVAPREAAEKGGMEVSLAVLAATSTTPSCSFR